MKTHLRHCNELHGAAFAAVWAAGGIAIGVECDARWGEWWTWILIAPYAALFAILAAYSVLRHLSHQRSVVTELKGHLEPMKTPAAPREAAHGERRGLLSHPQHEATDTEENA